MEVCPNPSLKLKVTSKYKVISPIYICFCRLEKTNLDAKSEEAKIKEVLDAVSDIAVSLLVGDPREHDYRSGEWAAMHVSLVLLSGCHHRMQGQDHNQACHQKQTSSQKTYIT